MNNNMTKELKNKIADYQRFGFILLAVSTFFYVGLVLPEDKSFIQSVTLGSASLICLSFTALMYNTVRKCKVKLQEISN
ncbi:YrhC family protein [Fictibacillus barbaricus]|uniref:YrhC-like protein n=1 Tax=Fictibacillus barbaricus TaxID=182136 RepID=A0ABU1U278_9BACL|nr:YrhC family protein [Fictibacillus barbaricus]MDR7073592.1 hypothetical protein [Fictibacillus barbaricus]